MSKFLTRTVLVGAVAFLGVTGFYTVDSKEEAVVTRFNRYIMTVSSPGPKWRIPFIDKVQKADISKVNRLEFGFRTIKEADSKSPAKYEDNIHEAQMITKDENLVLAEVVVLYKINDAKKFFFDVDNPVETLRIVAESINRRTVGSNSLDGVLTENKTEIQNEIRDYLQKTCDKYGLGVSIIAVQLQDVNPPTEVDAAFKDVASAKEDKNSKINEANNYKNEKVPQARGQAVKLVKDAEGYKTERINNAKGDVANFEQVLAKYNDGKATTRTRMYLEVLEEVLPNMEKYIVDEKGDTVKFLPLDGSKVIPAATDTDAKEAKK